MADDSWRRHWAELAEERVAAAVVALDCVPATLRSCSGDRQIIDAPFGTMYKYEYGWVALVSPEVLSGRESLADRQPNFVWMDFAARVLEFCRRNKVSRLFFDQDGLSANDERGPVYAELEVCRTLVTFGKLRVTEPGVLESEYPAYLKGHEHGVVWDADTAMDSVEIV